MSDTSRLVEQARKGADKYERAAWFEVSDLLTKLADEVERLQRERDEWADGYMQRDRDTHEARARVFALEAGIAEHRDSAVWSRSNARLWALLDAEEQTDE